MGRPSKLTPATESVILDALRAGATRTDAFEAAGIARSKISVYLKRFGTFRDAVIEAEAAAALRAVVTVRQAINAGDWRAASWWLERRRHDEWGRRDRIELRATIQQLAREHGLTVDEEREALAEAERIVREAAHGER
jgi:hypothetical protein